MKNLNVEKQQRYQNLFNEARNVCFMFKTKRNIWNEEPKKVLAILSNNISYDEYVEEISRLIGIKLSKDDRFVQYNYSTNGFVILSLNKVRDMYETSMEYNNDSEFLYYGHLADGVVCINNANDRAGWRDLRDNDDLVAGIYDYFMNDEVPNTLLRYNKPITKGDYSGQTPVTINPIVD